MCYCKIYNWIIEQYVNDTDVKLQETVLLRGKYPVCSENGLQINTVKWYTAEKFTCREGEPPRLHWLLSPTTLMPDRLYSTSHSYCDILNTRSQGSRNIHGSWNIHGGCFRLVAPGKGTCSLVDQFSQLWIGDEADEKGKPILPFNCDNLNTLTLKGMDYNLLFAFQKESLTVSSVGLVFAVQRDAHTFLEHTNCHTTLRWVNPAIDYHCSSLHRHEANWTQPLTLHCCFVMSSNPFSTWLRSLPSLVRHLASGIWCGLIQHNISWHGDSPGDQIMIN